MYVHMCAASFVCVQVCMVCMHLHVEVRGQPHLSFLMNVHVGFLRPSFTRSCCPLIRIRLGCLAGNLRCLSVSASSVWSHHNCLFVAWLFYTSSFLSGYLAVSPTEWSPNLIFICGLALLGTFLFLPFLSSLAPLSPFTPPLPSPRGFCLFVCFVFLQYQVFNPGSCT